MGDIIEHVYDIEISNNKYICIHNRNKYNCIECKGNHVCIHSKIKYRCNECGVKWRCPHGHKKLDCKECNSKDVCIHDKFKQMCGICDGRWLCSHGRQKAYCKECGGSQYCEHKIRKSNCKICKGNQICIHEKIKYVCVDCSGNSLCKHNKNKSSCKECGGSLYCEHNITKAYCKVCKGAAICIHNNYRKRCIDCGGAQVCPHKKLKNTCVLCKGSQICIHNKLKYSCKECDGRNLCKSDWCHISGSKKYNGYCYQCTIHLHPEIPVSRNHKTKETIVREYITEMFPMLTCISDKKIIDGCSRRRPDILIDMGSHIIIVEIDENQHIFYDTTCENRRLMEISKDVHHRPIVFIRFNPDGYISNNIKYTSCWKTGKDGITRIVAKKMDEWGMRLATLKTHIEYWINVPSEKTLEVIQLFYDKNDADLALQDALTTVG